MNRHLLSSLLLLLSAVAAAAYAGLVPADYDRWQAFNGWPIQVIEFPGIHSFSRSELHTVMATEKPTWLRRYVRIGSRTTFYADDFAADIIRLERFYAREGFPHAVVHGIVTPRESYKEVKLKVEVTEGPAVILEHWSLVMGSLNGARVDSARWALLMPVKIGKRLSLSGVKASADTLAYKLREGGHARARVDYKIMVDSLRYRARVIFTMYPGAYCLIGQTHITGLKQVSEGTARRELTYHEMEPYAPSRLEETRKRLMNMEAFTYVSVRADTAAPGDTLTIWIQTEEGWRYRIRFGGGYDTDERSRATVEFKDLNFFGRGRRLTWSNTLAEFHRQTEIRLLWPHTPWNATAITLAPKWEFEIVPKLHVETRSSTTILSATPLPKVTAALSNEVGRVYRWHVHDTTLIKSYGKSVETFALGWDTRDHPLVPRKGHFLGASFAESGAFYRTDLRWWRARFFGRALVPADRFTVLAGRVEFGFMGPLHETHVTPVEERFYSGGASSVRGWGRQTLSPRSDDATRTPIGGNTLCEMTAEIRRDIWGPVALAAFCDAGNVWRNEHVWQPLNLYPSAGVGLLVVTPVGPIRVDYAYQLRLNPYHEKNRWAIHFTLGSPI
jgi:outer membrane protein assembly factor BamA